MPDNFEFDVNSVAAELLANSFDKIGSITKGTIKGATDKVRLRLQKTYVKYLTDVARRYSVVKTFILRDEPRPLYSLYVPLGLKSSSQVLEKVSLQSLALAGTPAIITGSAGSGKSLFMRHLLMDALSAPNRVPVFVELRKLNRSNASILNLIHSTIRSHAPELEEDYIGAALHSGHFLLLLDGFDEVELERRGTLTYEILDLTSSQYQGNMIIMSSRPDRQIEAWHLFKVFEVRPLSLADSCDLVARLPIDGGIKERFVEALRHSIYDDYPTFVSNPLLLSIMLLTFAQNADIPKKLNIFYMQAYEVLFQRHDALKSAFKRERLCRLDIQQFADVFSAFSILTYEESMVEFPYTTALDKLKDAREMVGFEFSEERFLHDALQAVCLLLEDGLNLRFAHRSFQEYFVARYLADASASLRLDLVRRYAKRVEQDSVLFLLRDMRPEIIEKDFILVELNRLLGVLGVISEAKIVHLAGFLSYLGLTFRVTGNGTRFEYEVSASGGDILAMVRACLALFDEAAPPPVGGGWVAGLSRQYAALTEERVSRAKERRVWQRMEGAVAVESVGDIKWDMTKAGDNVRFIEGIADSSSIFSLEVVQFLVRLRSMLEKKYHRKQESARKLLGLGE